MASNMMKIEIRTRKMPFAKPERVSIRPYLKRIPPCQISFGTIEVTSPYVNLSLGGHVAMMDASRPTPIAIQSKPMWIAVDRSSSLIDGETGTLTTYHQISDPDYSSRYRTAFVPSCKIG